MVMRRATLRETLPVILKHALRMTRRITSEITMTVATGVKAGGVQPVTRCCAVDFRGLAENHQFARLDG